MSRNGTSQTCRILGAFSDFPLCAPDPLAEFTERARKVLDAPIAAIWRGDLSPGQLLLERTWNLSAAEAITLWAEVEGSITLDAPSILDLDESPWSFRSPAAKRIKSLLYLPLMSSQRFLGSLLFARPTSAEESFTREELLGLRFPLQAVAFALENERLAAKAEVMTQRLELLANAVPVPVCFLDANLNVTQPNDAFRRLMRLPDDFRGGEAMRVWRQIKDCFANPPLVETHLQEALKQPELNRILEVEFSGPEECHYRFMGVPFLDRQNRFTGGAIIGFDISPDRRLMRLQQENINDLDAKVQERTEKLNRAFYDLQLAHDELRRTDQIKTDFMSNMSHELRTPLNRIMGYASMLMDGVAGPLNPDQEHFVDHVMQGSDEVLKLVNAILDLTRIDAGKFTLHPTWNDYHELLVSVVEAQRPLLAAKSLTIRYELDASITTLWFSPEEIQQVVSNLLSNAVKFTDAGGSITLRTYREGDGVVTEVQDTGIGIAPDSQQKVFERFYQVDSSLTRRYGGSGLGLAIVKQLVELHGGAVSVESEPGNGACFRFWLGQPASVSPALQ